MTADQQPALPDSVYVTTNKKNSLAIRCKIKRYGSNTVACFSEDSFRKRKLSQARAYKYRFKRVSDGLVCTGIGSIEQINDAVKNVNYQYQVRIDDTYEPGDFAYVRFTIIAFSEWFNSDTAKGLEDGPVSDEQPAEVEA